MLANSSSLPAVAATHYDRKPYGIKFKEKRLDIRIWRCKGDHQKGSHFPICVFTNNVGRRSPEKLEERKRKYMQRSWRGPQWWTQGSQEGCRARSKSRPRGDIPAVARDWTAVAGDQPRMGRQSGEWGGVGESFQDRSDRWSATWNPGYAARPDSWRESWAVPDAGRWPAAAVVLFCNHHRGKQDPMDKMSGLQRMLCVQVWKDVVCQDPFRDWRTQSSYIFYNEETSCYSPQSRCYSPQSRCLRRSRCGTSNTVSSIRGCHRGFRNDN